MRSKGSLRVLFIRHAESQYNVRRLCNDDPHIPVDITPRGRRAAMRVADTLRDEQFDAIFTSQFPRAIETAHLLSSYGGPFFVDPRLNDRQTGLEGHPVREFKAAVAYDPVRGKTQGGESFLDQKQRVIDFLQYLRATTYRRVLVVSHHEPLRGILSHLAGIDDLTATSLHVGNLEGFRMHIPKDGPLIVQDLEPIGRNKSFLGTYLRRATAPFVNGRAPDTCES